MRCLSSLFAYVSTVVVAVLAAFPQSATAQATFELAFSGPGTYTPNGFFCATSGLGSPECAPQPIQWVGTVTLVLADDADGAYAGDSFISLAIQSNLFNATSPGLNLNEYNPVPGDLATVVLSNGQVTAFEFFSIYTPSGGDEGVLFTGMEAFYGVCCGVSGPWIEAHAVVTNAAVTNIPEPEIVSLMLAGLLVGLVKRVGDRSRRAVKGKRG